MEKPCLSCALDKRKGGCDRKNCLVWSRWFVHTWNTMRDAVLSKLNKEK